MLDFVVEHASIVEELRVRPLWKHRILTWKSPMVNFHCKDILSRANNLSCNTMLPLFLSNRLNEKLLLSEKKQNNIKSTVLDKSKENKSSVNRLTVGWAPIETSQSGGEYLPQKHNFNKAKSCLSVLSEGISSSRAPAFYSYIDSRGCHFLVLFPGTRVGFRSREPELGSVPGNPNWVPFQGTRVGFRSREPGTWVGFRSQEPELGSVPRNPEPELGSVLENPGCGLHAFRECPGKSN